MYTGAFVIVNNLLRGFTPASEQAHMVLDFLPLPSLNIGGISVIKKRDLEWSGWFRNAKRHRQDTKNLVELISKIRGMYIHIK